ncbi:MAG: hypothetical protein JWR59_68 [Brevundimonas sp.]|nr:hypothetical protein [Brevundimonas sp.]
MEQAHTSIEALAQLIELLGVGIILSAVAAATLWFVWQCLRTRDLAVAYQAYRANLGRGILLGLELLVCADIIGTITAPLTFESVGLLAVIVAIRTFLSFSLETEIEGCWPWRRRQVEAAGAGEKAPSR